MKSQSDETNETTRAFVREFTELQPGLRAFIGYLLNGAGGASDLTQDVNLVLWEKRDHFEAGTNFRAWAFTVARYEVLSHLRRIRKEGKKVLFSAELVDRLAEEWQDESFDHEKHLVALEYCLEKLPSDDLDLMRARYRAHGGVERFAEKVGRNAGTLRLRLFRLRAALKRCVEKQIEEEGDFA